MKVPRIALVATLGLLLSCQSQTKVEYLKEEPPKGSVRYGKVVYVDDGTCPKGEVKEIAGGNQDMSIPRKVRCIPRPN